MNLALWIATGLLAAVALGGGISKAFIPKENLAAHEGGRWTQDSGDGFVKALGVLELLAAVGLIMPALVDVAPVMVPVTAVCWVVLMVGAMITHGRKEAYVGPWLPEPLLTAPDVAENVELAESVSMALMLVLETLSPTERAVFVLREVFDVDYDEIAAAVGKSPAAVRQIAHRARRHIDARRPRSVVSVSETRAALESFQRALETRDLQGLLDVLAPEVVVVSDGGGIKQAALRPIIGAEKVVRFLAGGLGKTDATITVGPAVVNGSPGLVFRLDGEIDGVMAARVEDARITGLYYVRNPEKLNRVASETPLTLR
ncbi:DoxX family protein [Streptomyces canarius]